MEVELKKKIREQRNHLLRSKCSSGKFDYWGMSNRKRKAYNMYKRIHMYVFRNHKSPIAEEYLGIDRDGYKLYLQSIFKKGMSWKNYGTVWQIDHIIPRSSFKFNTNSDIKKCFNYKNTQPLFKSENLSKFDKNGDNVYLYSKDIKQEFKQQNFTENQIYFLAKYLPLLYTIQEFKDVLKEIKNNT